MQTNDGTGIGKGGNGTPVGHLDKKCSEVKRGERTTEARSTVHQSQPYEKAIQKHASIISQKDGGEKIGKWRKMNL